MPPEPFLTQPRLSWRFPAVFWVANVAELFERAAYYGMFIAITLFLTKNVGFDDIQTGDVCAVFASSLYLLPILMGALSDKMGFRVSLMLAFALLTVGYFILAAVPTKPGAVLALAVIAFGGAFVKPVISGTVAKCSDDAHRARAFSLFYWMINIGSFTGKTVAAPLRQQLGLEYINYYAAAMSLAAFVWIAFFYWPKRTDEPQRSFREVLVGLARVVRNVRFMALIVIVAGFWTIQTQLYSSMPKYILRLLGDAAKPEWLANINPFVVVLCVVPITQLLARVRAENAIGLGLFIISVSALSISLSSVLESVAGRAISVFGLTTLQPITIMVVLGIGMQGLAECCLSPKFLEYVSRQAPKGQEGLYMGYQNLPTAFSYILGFVLSGRLIDRFCPDPAKLPAPVFEQWKEAIATGGPLPEVYAHAHYIWYAFAGIGLSACLALCVFRLVTTRLDRVAIAISGGAAGTSG